MKMISEAGFAGISLFILIGMFGEGTSESSKICQASDWKQKCKEFIAASHNTHGHLTECQAHVTFGTFIRCCKGAEQICNDCEWKAEWEFHSKVVMALGTGSKPDYCNNYERPGVCGKGPTSDKNACAPGGSGGFAFKSSLLLMLATITITLLLRPMLI